jgi:hypothetical protein
MPLFSRLFDHLSREDPNSEENLNPELQSLAERIYQSLNIFTWDDRWTTLLKKLQQHAIHHSLNGLDVPTLADAIKSHPEFFTTNMRIFALLQRHEEENRAAANRIKKELAAGSGESTLIWENEQYKLVSLVSREQLRYETAYTGNCVGDDTHGDDYWANIQSGAAEIFSFRDKSTNQPFITIEYYPANGYVNQIKKAKNKLLQGDEPYFSAFLTMLKQLSTTGGSNRPRRITDVGDDLNELHLSEFQVLTYDGRVLPLTAANPLIIKRVQLPATDQLHRLSEHQPELDLLAQIPNIYIDCTYFPDSWKKQLTSFAGYLIDKSAAVDYPQLTQAGSFSAHEALRINLPAAAKVGSIYANKASSLIISALEKTDAINAPNLDIFMAPQLVEGGSITISNANLMYAPRLTTCYSIRAEKVTEIDLPQLTRALQLYFNASHISLPRLQKVKYLAALNSQQIDLPQLQYLVDALETNAQCQINAPLLSDASRDRIRIIKFSLLPGTPTAAS